LEDEQHSENPWISNCYTKWPTGFAYWRDDMLNTDYLTSKFRVCRTIFLSLNKMVSTVYQCDIDIKSIKVVPVIKSG